MEVHEWSLLGAVFLTALGMLPVCSYVVRGWEVKRQDILSSLSREAKALYLAKFLRIEPDDPDAAFGAMFQSRYGRWRFLPPCLLLVIVLLPEMYVVSETGLDTLRAAGADAAIIGAHNPGGFLVLPSLASAAIVGAYLWVVADLISGARRIDLSPWDVALAALRLSTAAPMGYALSSIVKTDVAPFVAFGVGAFPLNAVTIIFRRLGNKQLGLDIAVDSKPDQVTKLDGVDPLVADRLQGADITTIAELAWCDPVQLAMRTGLAFDFVLDIVSQSLAYVYFQERMGGLRAGGLRGAIEIRTLLDRLWHKDALARKQATRALISLARTAGVEYPAFCNACREIADDPYTVFLAHIWQGFDTAGAATARPGQAPDLAR